MTIQSHFSGPFVDAVETAVVDPAGDSWAVLDEMYADAIARIARLADGGLDAPADLVPQLNSDLGSDLVSDLGFDLDLELDAETGERYRARQEPVVLADRPAIHLVDHIEDRALAMAFEADFERDAEPLLEWTIDHVNAELPMIPVPARSWDDEPQLITDDLAVSVGGLTLPRAARHAAADTAQLPRIAA